MTLFVLSFLLMTGLSFLGLLLAIRPSPEQKAMAKRFTGLKSAPGLPGGETAELLLAIKDGGAFALIERFIQRYKISAVLERLILQAGVDVTVGKLIFLSGLCGFGTFGLAFAIKPILGIALLAGVPASSSPMLFLRWKRRRKLDAFNAALADSIDMMSRSLRAGHSVVAAIGIVAEQAVEPVKSEFHEVFKKQNYGLPLRDALMQLIDRIPSQDLRVLVTGMLVQKETGGNLAEILDRICFVIRERLRIQGEIRTHTAQGRLTGWILCLLPIVMLVLINWINPGYSNILFDTATGHKLLYLGIGLLVCGGFAIRRIVNGIEV